MSAKRDPLVYAEDILESINLIFQYTKNQTEKSLKKSPELKDAILLRFEIIGEAATRLPEDFRKTHKDIPWRNMIDMRNKILHEYFGWNWHIIWMTIVEDLPKLKDDIEKLIQEISGSK